MLGAIMDVVHAEFSGYHHEAGANLCTVAHKHNLNVVPLFVGWEIVQNGDDVANFLSGVVVVGHAVDDWHLGIFG